jgi:hypothetical protein
MQTAGGGIFAMMPFMSGIAFTKALAISAPVKSEDVSKNSKCKRKKLNR